MRPDYFLHHLTLSEAYDYVKGQDRRQRQSWEQTRALANVIRSTFTGEPIKGWVFPWEKVSDHGIELDDEEQRKFEELKQKCIMINQRNGY